MRRVLGIIMLIIGLVGIVLSVAGARSGYRLIDEMSANLDSNLQLTIHSLQTVNQSLQLTRTTVQQISDGLGTMETTASHAATSLDETRPMLRQISQITSGDLADGLETLQDGMPDLIEVAATIDETLTTLSRFRIDRTILGIPLRYDLGINYNPEQPFAESVEEIGTSIEGLPEELRSLESYFEDTDGNVATISDDLATIAGDVATIRDGLDGLHPLLDEFSATITEFGDATRQTRTTAQVQLETFRTVWMFVMVWLGLTQIAPLYLGYELVRGRR
jgi:X-X-X-Leu-X-X-Gly heptad repeat protein